MSAGNRYNLSNINTMELVYGTGYLSMGGDEEVANIISMVEVKGKDILDVGCGLGGAAIALVGNHGAKSVQGIDIDIGVLLRATELVNQAGMQDRITLNQFDPGPLPLADNSCDLVFLTAVSCHVEDLEPFFTEILRVIRPGGSLVGGEWFKEADNDVYREWDELLRTRGLNFYFVTRSEFKRALTHSGFEKVSIANRNIPMLKLSQSYLQKSETELKPVLLDTMGEEGYESLVQWTRVRAKGLAGGGSGYGHFVACKPAGQTL